jgi:peptidoglycan/xylan/chitin deacetylase (PgdA/CDA1 family)
MIGHACVLTLHRIVREPERDHDVGRSSLARLLAALQRAEASFAARLEPPVPRSVVLTFDDATSDHRDVGRWLEERGVQAIFFVPSGSVGSPGHLSKTDLRDLALQGHAVGSHSVDHKPLAGLTLRGLRRQVDESKSALEQILGQRVRYFAAPGGISHPSLTAELERAGYQASRSMRWGLRRHPAERWQIPCLPVTEYTLRRGWIESAALRGTVPASMGAVGRVCVFCSSVV